MPAQASPTDFFQGLDLKTWLGLAVVGAVVSTSGAIFGIILKEHVFSRSLEKWKHRQTLAQIYNKFRDPLLLAASELASRTSEILRNFPTVYLRTAVLTSHPEKQAR